MLIGIIIFFSIIGAIIALSVESIQKKEKEQEFNKKVALYKNSGKSEKVLINSNMSYTKRIPLLDKCPNVAHSFQSYTDECLTEILIDESSKQIAICDYRNSNTTVINFIEIIQCEIIENNDTLYDSGIGGAIIGGVLSGGVGAIVGSNIKSNSSIVNSLQLRIVTKNINNAMFLIDSIPPNVEAFRSSEAYRYAMNQTQEAFSTITSIIHHNQSNISSIYDPYLEVEKLSALKDKGIISENEFIMKKKEILRLN